MDYESFYSEYQVREKKVKEKVAIVNKYFKAIGKDGGRGEYKNLIQDTALLQSATEALQAEISKLIEYVSCFDNEEYYQGGDFVKDFLESCKSLDIDVAGDAPVLEMFPYKVRIDASAQDVYVNKKKYSSSRPAFVASAIKQGLDKLNSANFNEVQFSSELENVYQVYLLKKDGKPGDNVSLKNIYKELFPMSRFKKEYDEQAFAFDIARLYRCVDTVQTKKGSHVVFGTGRKDAIRVLDEYGQEVLLSTISFRS